MLEKRVLTILELNRNQRLGHKKTKLNIYHHTRLQHRSFHVVERTRTSSKCQKMKYARAKRAKILFFIVKYANLWGFLLPSSSWLLKLPIIWCTGEINIDWKSCCLGIWLANGTLKSSRAVLVISSHFPNLSDFTLTEFQSLLTRLKG